MRFELDRDVMMTSSSQVVYFPRPLFIAVGFLPTSLIICVLVPLSPLPHSPVMFPSVWLVTTLSLVAPTTQPLSFPTFFAIAVSVSGLTNLSVV